MFAETILALGLLFTTATQLRIPGAPVGPGEMLLVGFLLLKIARAAAMRDFRLNRSSIQLLSFWVLFAVSLSLGSIVALTTDEAIEAEWVLHDVMAYPLVAAVIWFAVSGPAPEMQMNRIAWLFVILGAISLACLVAAGEGLLPLPIEPWFWERFRGWSQNPNQLSELCGALVLVSAHLIDVSARFRSLLLALLCMGVATYVGILTQSDTFKYALIVVVPLFLLLKLRTALSIGWDVSLALLAIVSVILSFPTVVPAPLPDIGFHASDVVELLSKEGAKKASHEADLRESLWAQAVHRGFIDSWLLGLGPGPHLIIPAEIAEAHANSEGQDAPGNTVHPKADGTANFEAHNTILDLFTQGGALAVVSFIGLLGMAFRRAVVCRRSGLMALVMGFCVFMSSGNIVRTPTLWFGLALCLVADKSIIPRAALGRSIPAMARSDNWARREARTLSKGHRV